MNSTMPSGPQSMSFERARMQGFERLTNSVLVTRFTYCCNICGAGYDPRFALAVCM